MTMHYHECVGRGEQKPFTKYDVLVCAFLAGFAIQLDCMQITTLDVAIEHHELLNSHPG